MPEEDNHYTYEITASVHANPMKKLAIILPDGRQGNALGTARGLCRILAGAGTSVTLGAVLGQYEAEEFSDLGRAGVQIRDLSWTRAEGTVLERQGVKNSSMSCPYIRPQDGGFDFLDCDAWILCDAPTHGVVAPLKSYAIYASSFSQRVMPEIYGADIRSPEWKQNINLIHTHREARTVFVHTERARHDVISFAGVPAERVVRLSPLLDRRSGDPKAASPSFKNRYFLWPTCGDRNQGQLDAFKTLVRYYEDYDGQLDVVITGNGSERLDPERLAEAPQAWQEEIRTFARDNQKILARHAHFSGYATPDKYAAVRQHAVFLWNTVRYGRGASSIVDAARAGTHGLTTDYPQMRSLCSIFGINAVFYPPMDVTQSARALKNMEVTLLRSNAPATFTLPDDYEAGLHTGYGELASQLMRQAA